MRGEVVKRKRGEPTLGVSWYSFIFQLNKLCINDSHSSSPPIILLNVTDKTKMIYTAATAEETTPAALGNGAPKGECTSSTASPRPSGLDSGQVIRKASVVNCGEKAA